MKPPVGGMVGESELSLNIEPNSHAVQSKHLQHVSY